MSTNNYTFNGTVTATSFLGSVSLTNTIIKTNQTTGFNNQIIAGNSTTVDSTTGEGLHLGYDNSLKVGSIYTVNGSATQRDMYFGMPGYIGTAANIHVSNLNIPATSTIAGQIKQNGTVLFHSAGTDSLFFGQSGPSLTSDGFQNCSFGNGALQSLADGEDNCAFGFNALKTAATRSRCCAFGSGACENVNGSLNIGIGFNSLRGAISGFNGIFNIGIGSDVGANLTTANDNILIGTEAGANYTTESANILIFNRGVAADTATIRIGRSDIHTRCFLQGIFSNSTSISSKFVCVTSLGQLGGISQPITFGSGTTTVPIGVSPTFTMVRFRYSGATSRPITSAFVTCSAGAGGTVVFLLRDETNSLDIATASTTSTTPTNLDLGPLANVPTGAAVFSILAYALVSTGSFFSVSIE